MTDLDDELGAHVSARGGVDQAPARARALDATVLQLFTKQPNRWADRSVLPDMAVRFRAARAEAGTRWCVSHDSYLINLASPDEALWARSLASFRAELERCAALGIEAVVTHPGNATDGDERRGIEENARGLGLALAEVPDVRVLLELTAGSGTSVGATFENLAAIREGVPLTERGRVGVCVDTCHAFAAGYDLVSDYDGVWSAYEAVLPLSTIELFHLNDSQHGLGSRKDRHAGIGEGTLGEDPFRRIVRDSRFEGVPKILETPKGDDELTLDRRNLSLLRGFRE
jgi:deoxyribonuclease-4